MKTRERERARIFQTLPEAKHFQQPRQPSESHHVIVPDPLILYSNLFSVSETLASGFIRAVLTVAQLPTQCVSHQHMPNVWLHFSQDLKSVFNVLCFDRMLLKRCQGFWGSYFGFFLCAQGKLFAYHRMLWYFKGRRGFVWKPRVWESCVLWSVILQNRLESGNLLQAHQKATFNCISTTSR